MATFLISMPVVVTRSIVVIADTPQGAAKRLIDLGAEVTERMPHVDATVAFYSNWDGVRYGFETLDTPASAEAGEPPPKGTVIQ